MIALTSCPKQKYFDVLELWFYYNEKMAYSNFGLMENERIFVSDKTAEYIVIETKISSLNISYEQAQNICGEVVLSKQKPKMKQKKRHW